MTPGRTVKIVLEITATNDLIEAIVESAKQYGEGEFSGYDDFRDAVHNTIADLINSAENISGCHVDLICQGGLCAITTSKSEPVDDAREITDDDRKDA